LHLLPLRSAVGAALANAPSRWTAQWPEITRFASTTQGGIAIASWEGVAGDANPSGTGLIEAVIATAVVVTALGLLAGLSTVAARSVMTARDRSLAVIHAQTKLERLRAQPVASPLSPPDALEQDVAGYVEYLDASGRATGQDGPGDGRVFVRRWRVRPVAATDGLQTITVRVGRCRAVSAPAAGCSLAADAVVLMGIRSEAVW
jgi:hypothetical protein